MPRKEVNTQQDEDNRISDFHGLNNVTDPIKLDLSWAVQADNVDVDKHGNMRRCDGYTQFYTATNCTGAYTTKDLQRFYLVDNGSLLQLFADGSTVTLATGLSSNPCYFDEVNGVVYLGNGTDFWILTGEGASPWGVPTPGAPTAMVGSSGALTPGVYQIVCTFVDANGMEGSNGDVAIAAVPTAVGLSVYQGSGSGNVLVTSIPSAAGYTTNVYATTCNGSTFYLIASGAGSNLNYFDQANLGRELPFWNTKPPRGTTPTFFAGRVYTSEYFPAEDYTIVWRSRPLEYHHFNYGREGIIVPGHVRVMKSSRETTFNATERLTQRGMGDFVLIGTDREIYSWDEDQLVLCAAYGVAPGWHAVDFKGKVYFWSLRGLCRALPFENLTEATVSVPPGLSAGAAVLEEDGTRRYVVALQKGGTAYNPWSR